MMPFQIAALVPNVDCLIVSPSVAVIASVFQLGSKRVYGEEELDGLEICIHKSQLYLNLEHTQSYKCYF